MRLAALALFATTVAASDERCIGCHPNEAAGLARSGMGRSFRVIRSDLPAGKFRHDASNSTVEIRGTTHAIRRGREAVARDVQYVVGSGNAGMSFLLRSGEWLYQSPVSYFSARRAWGPSPGYEKDSTLDFSRPIPDECIFCHAGSSEWVEGSINRFRDPPGSLQGIPCERCHGPGAGHIVRPSRQNIVNPARLTGSIRDGTCEQCHLGGVARVLNAGKRWRDYVPGGRLEDIGSVYVWGQADSDAALHVVSHVEQLAASACARASQGTLWCGSCHSVHGKNAGTLATCRSCHASAHKAENTTRTGDCASCHMPKRPTADGGHIAFTDHRIRRRPPASSTGSSIPGTLRAWRRGAKAPRNEGLAYIQIGDRLQSADLVQRGFKILAERQKEFETDAEVLAALGYVLLQKNRPREAASLLDRAVRLAPATILFRLNLGLALGASGETTRARSVLEELRSLDPSVEAASSALRNLTNR